MRALRQPPHTAADGYLPKYPSLPKVTNRGYLTVSSKPSENSSCLVNEINCGYLTAGQYAVKIHPSENTPTLIVNTSQLTKVHPSSVNMTHRGYLVTDSQNQPPRHRQPKTTRFVNMSNRGYLVTDSQNQPPSHR